MIIRILLLFSLMLSGCLNSYAETYKYRVTLRDKSLTTYSLDRPQEFLSERALERRHRQGIDIDSTDLPVCKTYIDRLVEQGGEYQMQSKWNNTVLMLVHDEETAERFRQNPYVVDVRKVWVSPDTVFPRNKDRKKEITNKWKKTDDYYGVASRQIKIHHGDSLHLAGFRGEGMHVAVIDAGYYNVDKMKFFRKLHILGTKDFVNPNSDIYAEHNHGLKVLSCMAVDMPKVMVGSAPGASYWLLRSEDNDTEQPAEEDYWAAAVEFADSVGVDVVNTSLGYYSFDDASNNYKYRDLDGRTSLMSRSASMASDKGMLIVCSAGNSGASSWKKITPPGDAEGILTVGAVNTDGINADFSSVGNTADGRIKPDVMAVGFHSSVAGTNGGTSYGNGTSFASPIFCGLVICLWQACPWLTVTELIDVVHRASDRYEYPDNIFGYGITDMWKAYRIGMDMKNN